MLQEKPKIDDFESRKKLVWKDKYFKKIHIVNVPSFLIYPCKNFKKYFCRFFCFRTF